MDVAPGGLSTDCELRPPAAANSLGENGLCMTLMYAGGGSAPRGAPAPMRYQRSFSGHVSRVLRSTRGFTRSGEDACPCERVYASVPAALKLDASAHRDPDGPLAHRDPPWSSSNRDRRLDRVLLRVDAGDRSRDAVGNPHRSGTHPIPSAPEPTLIVRVAASRAGSMRQRIPRCGLDRSG